MENGVFRREWAWPESRFLLCFRRWRRIIIGRIGIVFRNGADNLSRSNAFLKNRLAAWIVVVGHRKEQRRAVIQSNQLLLGSQAKRALADHIPAMICRYGRCQNFRRS